MARTKRRRKIGPIKKNALHRQMGVPKGQKIGKKRLRQAAKSPNKLKAKRARFALNMNKGRRKKGR